jgi:hypothetical protein
MVCNLFELNFQNLHILLTPTLSENIAQDNPHVTVYLKDQYI